MTADVPNSQMATAICPIEWLIAPNTETPMTEKQLILEKISITRYDKMPPESDMKKVGERKVPLISPTKTIRNTSTQNA